MDEKCFQLLESILLLNINEISPQSYLCRMYIEEMVHVTCCGQRQDLVSTHIYQKLTVECNEMGMTNDTVFIYGLCNVFEEFWRVFEPLANLLIYMWKYGLNILWTCVNYNDPIHHCLASFYNTWNIIVPFFMSEQKHFMEVKCYQLMESITLLFIIEISPTELYV